MQAQPDLLFALHPLDQGHDPLHHGGTDLSRHDQVLNHRPGIIGEVLSDVISLILSHLYGVLLYLLKLISVHTITPFAIIMAKEWATRKSVGGPLLDHL